MRKTACWTAVVMAVVLFAGCAGSGTTSAGHHMHKPTYLGTWESTSIEGEAAGDVSKVEITLKPAFEFAGIATASDGTGETATGTYSVEGNKLMIMVDGEDEPLLGEFSDEGLVLTVPDSDSRIILKRK